METGSESNRKRVPVTAQSPESRLVAVFFLNHAQPDASATPLPVASAFEAYKKWLSDKDYGESLVSVDGFGRMVPKVYPRTWVTVAGKTRRCLIGLRLS